MIRIIVAETDACAAANVGGPIEVSYRTFDVEAPEVEAFLAEQAEWNSGTRALVRRSITGFEVLP